MTAPPQTAAQPEAPAPPIAAVPAAVEIQLEESTGPVDGGESMAAPLGSSGPLDPALAFPPSEPQGAEGPQPAAPPRSGQSKDFWDGFYGEEQEAAAMQGEPAAIAGEPAAMPGEPAAIEGEPAEMPGESAGIAEAPAAQVPPDQASGFQLRDDREDASDDDTARVGGYGSGLFTDDAGNPVQAPAFAEDESAGGEDRAWSYYDDADGEQADGERADGERADGDRGWSYDDDPAEQAGAQASDSEEPPAFRSPVADREDLVVSAKSSRFSDIVGWRPSLPSFSLGSSALGTRARDALGVLDAILEENGTDDIPKSFIIGLGGFAALLGVVAFLIVLFG